jgi:hypothetical protein
MYYSEYFKFPRQYYSTNASYSYFITYHQQIIILTTAT